VGHSRSIDGNSLRAYRVKKVTNYEDRPAHVQFYGPYSTLGAAKGKRTTEIGYVRHYYTDASKIEITIEQTPEGWEKVEIAD
jgi:hypothetical protein